jgi:rubrerythrin
VDVERGCLSKQTYLTKEHAKQVVRLMKRRHRGEQLHQYRCPSCGYHHVGHVVPESVRRAAAEPRWSTEYA